MSTLSNVHNLARVESYAREVQSILASVDQAQGQIDQMNGFLQMADAAKDHQQELQIAQRKKETEKQRAVVLQMLLTKTGKAQLEDVYEFLEDLTAVVNAAHQERGNWRRVVQEYEFSVANTEGFDRAAASEQLEKAKTRVEKRVEAAYALVPNQRVVIRPGDPA